MTLDNETKQHLDKLFDRVLECRVMRNHGFDKLQFSFGKINSCQSFLLMLLNYFSYCWKLFLRNHL